MILPYNQLSEIFSAHEIPLSETKYSKLEKYAELLLSWNEKMNLTAIKDPYGISVKHFLDSIIPLKYVDIPENSSIIDVGTGAGFPSLPMKIYREDLQIFQLDSLQKRLNFLEEVSNELGYSDIKKYHLRAEDGGKSVEHREKYDFATARAVASMPILCEYCLPFVKVGGKFIALKGKSENLSDSEGIIAKLGGKISDIISYKLSDEDERQLFIIEKVAKTPKNFPRKNIKKA